MLTSARNLERALVGGGAVLLAALVWRSGVEAILADIAVVGWGFALIVAAEGPVIAISAAGWWYAIAPESRRIPLRRLARFRIAGEAVNHLTPTATLGGEFVRARLAAQYIGAPAGAASVTLAKFTETAGQYVFGLLGLVFVFDRLPGLSSYQGWAGAMALAAICGVALLGVLLWRGIYSTGARWLGRFGRFRSSLHHHRANIFAVDDSIRQAFERRPGDIVLSTLILAFSFSLRAIEVWIILTLLGLPATLVNCVGIEVLSVLVNSVFFFMPAKVGTQEGGKMLIFALLGLPPEKGLVLGLVRRARELTWDVAGLAVYAAERRRTVVADEALSST